MTTKYVLKESLNGEPVLDGIIPGIGDVRHGVPVTPYSPEQEEQLKEDPRFKQYREASVTDSATVDTKADTKDATSDKKAGK